METFSSKFAVTDDSSLSGDDLHSPRQQSDMPALELSASPDDSSSLESNSSSESLPSSSSSSSSSSDDDGGDGDGDGDEEGEYCFPPPSADMMKMLHQNDTFDSSSGVDSKHDGSTSATDSGGNTSRNKSPTGDLHIDVTSSGESPRLRGALVQFDDDELGSGSGSIKTEPINLELVNEMTPTPTNFNFPDGDEAETVIIDTAIPTVESVEKSEIKIEVHEEQPVVNNGFLGKVTTPRAKSADPQLNLTVRPLSMSPKAVSAEPIQISNSSEMLDEDDLIIKRHLEKLQKVPFGKTRAQICKNCTSFDEAVARSQRDAVFSDQQMWRNLQFMIREKYTSFAKLEAISRIQEKVQELVGFVDSSVLTNSCWSAPKSRQAPRVVPSPGGFSSTKELPDDLGVMLQLFNSEVEATQALSNWLSQSVEAACIHLDNATKFYMFESELGHCHSWMANSLEAASHKLDQLAESDYLHWQKLQMQRHDNETNNNNNNAWLAVFQLELENCTRLLYFWREKVERLLVACRRLSPVNKRSPTQRGIYTPADNNIFSSSPPINYLSSGKVANSIISPTASASSAAPSSTSITAAASINNTNTSVPGRLILDYSTATSTSASAAAGVENQLNRGTKVNVNHMNSGRSTDLPHYWLVEPITHPGSLLAASPATGGFINSTYDIPNYICELLPTDQEMRDRQDVVAEIAGILVASGRNLLKSLHNFVYGFIRANFPSLDDNRAQLLMSLDLDVKLDALNVIDETIAFVQRTSPTGDLLSDERRELLDLLYAYRSALLNERKTQPPITDQPGNRTGTALVTNVEILKQLLFKANQLDSYWDLFSDRALNLKDIADMLNEDGAEDEQQRNERKVLQWYKLVDVEPDKDSDALTTARSVVFANEHQQPIIMPILVDNAVQTGDEYQQRFFYENQKESAAAQAIAQERPLSSSSSEPSSAESDMVVQSEVAEERRRFTIKGVVKAPGSRDLISWREAISRGVVDPDAGTCQDLEHPYGERLPIPVAIERGFIVIEHQSEAEVLRREQKTEHVVTSRPGSKRFKQRPQIRLLDEEEKRDEEKEERIEQQQPKITTPKPRGTSIFLPENDNAPPIITNRSRTNSPAPRPPSGYSHTQQSLLRSPTPPKDTPRSPTSRSKLHAHHHHHYNQQKPKTDDNGLQHETTVTITKPSAIISPTKAVFSPSPITSRGLNKSPPGASSLKSPATRTMVLISREKLASPQVTITTSQHIKHSPPTPLTEDGGTKTRMSLIQKQLEKDLKFTRHQQNFAVDVPPPKTPEPRTPVTPTTIHVSSIKAELNNNSPGPRTPVRSQVGTRGSVRKIAKFFETKA